MALAFLLFQNAASNRGHSVLSTLSHWGAFGLFLLAILDSSPLPTFGGPDVLLVILVSLHRSPWYEQAAVATAGSIIGAYLTFRISRKAGDAYLNAKFGETKVSKFLEVFKTEGTGTLIASSAIPFPFPTSLIFAAAGASDYHPGKFLITVTLSRCVRYFLLAEIADRYGRRVVGILRHPTQHWGWLLLFASIAVIAIGAGILFNKRLAIEPAQSHG